jgi:hypothetical protein
MANSSQLIEDLTQVPNIIGRLGLSIAEAQKAFNLNYLENLEQIVCLIKKILGDDRMVGGEKPSDLQKFSDTLKEMLMAMAPSRYQYSETTFTVRLDLAQSTQFAGTVGVGLGYGGIAINAAFTIGYGFDYRAAAECHTVIHAIPADQTVFKPLLERAKEIHSKALEFTSQDKFYKAMAEQSSKIVEKMVGSPLPSV